MEFKSLNEAAEYAHVCRQAMFLAIRKGQLKAEKRTVHGQEQWHIEQKDLDDYRANKYNREKRVYEGQKLFDLDNDRWSVLHAAKTLSEMLGRHYPLHHLYYLLRIGRLRAQKHGNAWVISREALIEIYDLESTEKSSDKQMRFA